MQNKRYVLITGATGGIGSALSRVFAQNGHNVLLLARDAEGLHRIAETLKKKYRADAACIPCDLLDRDGTQRALDTIETKGYAVEVLVNAAGTSNFGEFKDTPWEDESGIIGLNIAAMTYLCKRVLPGMIAAENGKILNIASVVGYYPLPYQAVYAASKAYVLSFSQALHSELRDTGVQVSTLCPGNVNTGFVEKSGLEKLYSAGMRAAMMEPEELAQTAYRELFAGKRIIYPDKTTRRTVRSIRFISPDKLADSQYLRRKAVLDR